MERLTKRESANVGGREFVLCNYKKEDCNDSCMYESGCKWKHKALLKLKEYEDLEEQGKLIRLPCKVGDTIYRINQYAKEPIVSMKVLQVRFGELYIGNKFLRIDAINDEDMGEFCYLQSEFGKNVFFTKEEAEQALAKMKEV